MDIQLKHQLVAYLSQFVTPARREMVQEVILNRTQHITVLLENIYQPHNASAVLRSCDCFGIQEVHIIEDRNRYRINPEVAMGATKWLTLHRYDDPELDNTANCIAQLKQDGYKIVATTLREGSISLLDFPIEEKLALCFGTEAEGLSNEVHQAADYFLQIPMYGFTQSYNISVSAALCLFELTRRIRNSDVDWQLPEEQHLDFQVEWLLKAATHGRALGRQFCRDMGIEILDIFLEPEEVEPEINVN